MPLGRVAIVLVVLLGLVALIRTTVADGSSTTATSDIASTEDGPTEASTVAATAPAVSRAAGDERTRSESQEEPSGPAPRFGRWTTIPHHPVLDRRSLLVATRGSLFAWGGGGWDAEGRPLPARADGAVLDLATMQWRDLPPAPLEPRWAHTGVWTGSEYIVWGGSGVSRLYADGAAYDPATDRWRTLASSDVDPQQGTQAVWTGAEMVVAKGHDLRHAPTGAAAYDPAADSWRSVPAPQARPVSGDQGDLVWALDRVIATPPTRWGPTGRPATEGTPLALAPATVEWQPLPDLPTVDEEHLVTPAVSGERLVLAVAGGRGSGSAEPSVDALAVLDDLDGPWRVIDLPEDLRPLALPGRESFVCAESSCYLPLAGGDILSIDPTTGDRAVIEPGDEARQPGLPPMLLPAGDGVIVVPQTWGSEGDLGDARLWRPGRPTDLSELRMDADDAVPGRLRHRRCPVCHRQGDGRRRRR